MELRIPSYHKIVISHDVFETVRTRLNKGESLPAEFGAYLVGTAKPLYARPEQKKTDKPKAVKTMASRVTPVSTITEKKKAGRPRKEQ